MPWLPRDRQQLPMSGMSSMSSLRTGRDQSLYTRMNEIALTARAVAPAQPSAMLRLYAPPESTPPSDRVSWQAGPFDPGPAAQSDNESTGRRTHHRTGPKNALVDLDDALWGKVVIHLDLKTFAKLCASCRRAWSRSRCLESAVLDPIPSSRLAAWKYALAILRVHYLTERCAVLKQLSMRSSPTASGDIWALATCKARFPKLEQLVLRFPAEWEQHCMGQVGEPDHFQGPDYLRIAAPLAEQVTAFTVFLTMLIRKAPRLQVLRANGFCLQSARALTALRFLTVDVWGSPSVTMPWVKALTRLVSLSMVGNRFVGQTSDFELQALASLTKFTVGDITPLKVQLPAACKTFELTWAGPSYHFSQMLQALPGAAQWLTSLDIDIAPFVPSELIEAMLTTRLWLADLKLTLQELGTQAAPFLVSDETSCVITQAQRLWLIVRSEAYVMISGSAHLAWAAVSVMAAGGLSVYHTKPQKLFSGQVCFNFCSERSHSSNLEEKFLEWLSVAERHGYTAGITKTPWPPPHDSPHSPDHRCLVIFRKYRPQ